MEKRLLGDSPMSSPLSEEQMATLVAKAKETREERYLELSRKRLDKIITTKMKTCFIGALSAFEETFGSLWGHGKDVEDLTPAEKQNRELWINTRTKILNNGNTQLRASQTEIANHVIKWNRYHIDFIVKPVQENS